MSTQDPLSEALEALARIENLLEPKWDADGSDYESPGFDDVQNAYDEAQKTLARLDALPAPYRVESSGTYRSEWCYPDAGGGEDAS